MAITSNPFPRHWHHFLSIEDDVLYASRWIDFDEPNFGTYSIELARLLMACSAEADVVAKQICAALEPTANASSINKYQEVITEHWPQLCECEVYLHRFGMILRPWSNWAEERTPPDWWTAYNKVKHHRTESFGMATLQHALNSAAGLFILVLIHYGIAGKRKLEPLPKIFDSSHFGLNDGDNLFLLVQG